MCGFYGRQALTVSQEKCSIRKRAQRPVLGTGILAPSVPVFHNIISYIRLRLVGFLAFFLLIRVLVWIMLNIILWECCVNCPGLFSSVILCHIGFQYLSKRFLKEFNVPANTIVGWQIVPTVYNSVSKINKCAY